MTQQEVNNGKRICASAIKSGRGWNGSHRDSGTIVHAVPPLKEGCTGYWGGKSLCGVEPGIMGNGWSESLQEINCEKCIKKINKSV